MDDLISRTELLNECAECQKTDPHFEERGWASHFINDAGEPSTEWYCVEDMIENAPSVDAIPVEWLEDAVGRYEYSGCIDSADVVMEVIKDWQKEQEGK